MTLEYLHTGIINQKYLHPELLTLYNAGIYTRDKDLKKMELYCKFYDMSIKNSDFLASLLLQIWYKYKIIFQISIP